MDSPLSLAASNLNSWLPIVLAIAALFATANAAFSGIISISRLLFGMASVGELPKFMTKTNAQKVPWVTTLVVMASVAGFLLFGNMKIIHVMSSLGALLVFVAVNIALIVLRFKSPEQERPFKVPLAIGRVPILPILAILISLSLIIQFNWQVYAAFAVAIIVGIVLDYFLDKRSKENIILKRKRNCSIIKQKYMDWMFEDFKTDLDSLDSRVKEKALEIARKLIFNEKNYF